MGSLDLLALQTQSFLSVRKTKIPICGFREQCLFLVSSPRRTKPLKSVLAGEVSLYSSQMMASRREVPSVVIRTLGALGRSNRMRHSIIPIYQKRKEDYILQCEFHVIDPSLDDVMANDPFLLRRFLEVEEESVSFPPGA